MIVVADTTPLNYLILIQHIDVLPAIYGSVLIPSAVVAEMLHPSAPPEVNRWAANLPSWSEIRDPGLITLHFARKLGKGEREAIAIAHRIPAGLLLIDETLGRKEAQQLGIQVIGTLGILKEAHQRNLLDLKEAIRRLQSTTFQMTDAVLKSVLGDIEPRPES